jgi:hypothetical protein
MSDPQAKAPRHAIWLDPESRDADSLRQLMNDLRRAHGGPSFPPHLTLTSGLLGEQAVVLERFHALCAGHPASPCLIDEPVLGEGPFQALMLPCRCPKLVALRQDVRRAWGLADEPWTPHLSLWYGLGTRLPEQAVETVRRRRLSDCLIAGCSLWYLDGPVENWRQVARISWA